MFHSTKQKNLSRVVFGIYLILLTWLVLFKFSTSLSALPNIRGINLIPFYYSQENDTHLTEVIYNVIVFVPFGVYVQIFKKNWKTITKFIPAFLTSLLFEIVQFIFAIGASDITDIICNTLGGIIGILFCIIINKIVPRKYISIINALGMIIEITAIALLVLLLWANR